MEEKNEQQAVPQQAGKPAKSTTALIVLSVLEIMFFGGLLGIIPLIFAIQANSSYSMGDDITGDAKAKTAKTALIVIAIIGVIVVGLVAAACVATGYTPKMS